MDRRLTFLCMLMLVILVMPGFAGGTKKRRRPRWIGTIL